MHKKNRKKLCVAHVVVTSKISKLVVALGQDSGATVCLISLRFPMNGVAVGISSVVAAAAYSSVLTCLIVRGNSLQ